MCIKVVLSNNMTFRDNIKIALAGLTVQKSRSALTILGIVIGITAIILITALGQSAENLIIGQVQNLGSANIYILPGRRPEGAAGFGAMIMSDSIKIKDIEDLQNKNNVPDAKEVIPVVFGMARANYGSESFDAMIFGTNAQAYDLFNLADYSGELFTDSDVSQKAEVIVIGQKVAEKLFGGDQAIGQKIKIKNKNFRVLGVLSKKGQSSFVDFDEVILGPYTTIQQDILGFKYFQRVVVVANSKEVIPSVIKQTETVLRDNHNITDISKDDFYVQTQDDIVKTLGIITTVLTVLLTSVAAISLIVGGIGIMNIMLVSVTERTREIGLRKALGATNKNILSQFLTEAVMLTLAGGIIGITFGSVLSWLMTLVLNSFFNLGFTFAFPLMGAFWGVLVSTLVGFVFGIFPAYTASKKSPMEALRYE